MSKVSEAVGTTVISAKALVEPFIRVGRKTSREFVFQALEAG
ncbi:hypothetical protein OOK13_41215 [Streptomyces sp. NBC_00378]|nr:MULTISPECIES: hypothetical protein [unclassified Streptomyces]MCX5114768.1 hypothetical protein [Streptomyces sp. NBC_00378]